MALPNAASSFSSGAMAHASSLSAEAMAHASSLSFDAMASLTSLPAQIGQQLAPTTSSMSETNDDGVQGGVMTLCRERDGVNFKDWLQEKLLEDRRRFALEVEMQHEALLAAVAEAWMLETPAGGSGDVAAPMPSAGTAQAPDQTPALQQKLPAETPASAELVDIVPLEQEAVDAPEGQAKNSGMHSLSSFTTFKKGKTAGKRVLGAVKSNLREDHAQQISVSRLRSGKRPVAGDFEFELIASGLICVGMIFTCLELQYTGYQVGYGLGMEMYDTDFEREFSLFVKAVSVGNMICNSLFTIELVLRLIDNKRRALRIPFIWFDFFIITVAWLQIVHLTTLNPLILRVFRLVRIVRLARLMTVMVAFRTLFLLIRSVVASFSVFLWTLVVIGAVQLASGMFVNQMLRVYLENDSRSLEDRQQVFEYFGTFALTMFTMFEITDANWVVSCRMLMRKVSVWWGLFFVLYRCFLFFSLGKIIAAVFISETNRVNEMDADLVRMKKAGRKAEYESRMWALLQHFCVEPGTCLTRTQFQEILASDKAATCRDLFGIEFRHLNDTFDLLENDDGNIPVETLLRELPKLKNPASSLEVRSLRKQLLVAEYHMMSSQRPSSLTLGSTGTDTARKGLTRSEAKAFEMAARKIRGSIVEVALTSESSNAASNTQNAPLQRLFLKSASQGALSL